MNTLGSIDIIDEATDLGERVVEILIVCQFDFFLLDRPNDSFGIAILARLAHRSHTDLHTSGAQKLDILRRGVLNALVAVMNDRYMGSQGALQRDQRQVLTERASELPAANIWCEDVQDDRQVDKATPKTARQRGSDQDRRRRLRGAVRDQIGKSPKAMLAVSGAAPPWAALTQQAQFTQEASHPLAIDREAIRRTPERVRAVRRVP